MFGGEIRKYIFRQSSVLMFSKLSSALVKTQLFADQTSNNTESPHCVSPQSLESGLTPSWSSCSPQASSPPAEVTVWTPSEGGHTHEFWSHRKGGEQLSHRKHPRPWRLGQLKALRVCKLGARRPLQTVWERRKRYSAPKPGTECRHRSRVTGHGQWGSGEDQEQASWDTGACSGVQLLKRVAQ